MSKYGYRNVNPDLFRLAYATTGTTAIHEASKQGQICMIKSMVKDNIKYRDMVDKNNMTPLHYAAVFKQKEAYDLLLELGANNKYFDNFGRTPESIMTSNNDIELSGDFSHPCCIWTLL